MCIHSNSKAALAALQGITVESKLTVRSQYIEQSGQGTSGGEPVPDPHSGRRSTDPVPAVDIYYRSENISDSVKRKQRKGVHMVKRLRTSHYLFIQKL